MNNIKRCVLITIINILILIILFNKEIKPLFFIFMV